MRKAIILRFAVVSVLALLSSAAPAAQIITFNYDASGRLISIVYSGSGPPGGCTNATATWGTGTLGCFRWTP